MRGFRFHFQRDGVYVLRRVEVPVVVRFALRARPFSLREFKLLENVSAVGARLARRIESRNFGDRRAKLERHPLEDGDELRKPEVAHLASPHPLHRLHVQIFDGDVRVFEAYLAGELEVMVFAAVRNVLVNAREMQARAFTIVRPFLFL